MKFNVIFFSLIALLPLAAHAGVNPGLWEATVTASSTMAGSAPVSEKTSYCITEKDPVPALGGNNTDACKIINQKVSGGSVSWRMRCDTPLGMMDSKGKITYRGDTAKGLIEMSVKSPSGTVNMQQSLNAKRIGDC